MSTTFDIDDLGLWLPGEIPGLLQRGSPVVGRERRPGLHGKLKTARGLWSPHSGPKGDEGLVMWDLSHGTRDRIEQPMFWANVGLDLTYAAGRSHARLWLCASGSPLASAFRDDSFSVNLLHQIGGHAIEPLIQSLRLDDLRTLPDSSRIVDVKALFRVVLYVRE